jgi:lipoprotein-anchoring transpeptidase ErfK/SrfK
MPRFSTALLFSTGFLLTTMLTIVPTKLQAQTQTQQPQINPTRSLPTQAGTDRQEPNRSQLDSQPAPSGSLNNSTTSKPVNNSIPTTKPTTAATTQPPVEEVVNLVLKLKEKRVYVYQGTKLLKKYPVAIGKKGWETPTGEWQVMEKIKNPAWTSFKTGEVFAPGTTNPLGSRWIGFWTDGRDVIGFHGTANVKSIGTAASHGCVRMRNRDVKALFPLVKVGTTVKVVNE